MDRRKLITATLFGVVIAVVKSPFTFPVTDYLIIVEVPILALGYLLLGRGGASYTGLVNGILQSAVKVQFFPYDLVFAILYGVLVDVFCIALRINGAGPVSAKRMMLSLGGASTVLGVLIALIFLAFNLNPGINLSGYTTMDLIEIVYAPIVIWGILSGILGGFVSARLWERNLKVRFRSIQPPVN